MSAALAIIGGCVLAAFAFLPFVVVSYRRRGELGFGRTLLAFGFLVYGLAIVTYTLLPLPDLNAAWCAAHESLRHPQTNVLQFIADIRREQHGAGFSALLHNPAFQQIAFNIALFVPLGAFLRQFFRRGPAVSVLIGFGVSLLVECTQLTGNWFLFPCPYRLFDVDDLIANTLGTVVGVALAPVLRVLGAREPAAAPGEPRRVTAWRRLLGMLLDLVSVYLLGALLVTVTRLTAYLVFGVDPNSQVWQEGIDVVLGVWLPALVLLFVPSMRGATVGQNAVRLRRVRADGERPGARGLLAALFGGGGYFVLTGLNTMDSSLFGPAPALIALLSFILIWPRAHRGLSGYVAGLYIVDSRGGANRPSAPAVSAGPATSGRR